MKKRRPEPNETREPDPNWSALSLVGATVTAARERIAAGQGGPDDAAMIAAAEQGARDRERTREATRQTPREKLAAMRDREIARQRLAAEAAELALAKAARIKPGEIDRIEAGWMPPTCAELEDGAADPDGGDAPEVIAGPCEVGAATLAALESTTPSDVDAGAARRAQLRAAERLTRKNAHKLGKRKRAILEARAAGPELDTCDELARATRKHNRRRARDVAAELKSERIDPAYRARHAKRMADLGLDPNTRPYPWAIQRMCAEIEGDRTGAAAQRYLLEACGRYDGHGVGALRRAALGRYRKGDKRRRDFRDERARRIVAMGLMLLYSSEPATQRGQWSRCTRGLGRGVLCCAAGRADVPRGDPRRRISLSTLRGHRNPERDDWGYLDALEESGFLWRQQLYGSLARAGEIGPSGHPTNTYWILGRSLTVAASKLPAYVELCAEGWADSQADAYGPAIELFELDDPPDK